MTTEEWVERLNALSREMGETEEAVHPSAWSGTPLPELMEKFRTLAAAETVDEQQLSLWGDVNG